jgi:hypothetical protein
MPDRLTERVREILDDARADGTIHAGLNLDAVAREIAAGPNLPSSRLGLARTTYTHLAGRDVFWPEGRPTPSEPPPGRIVEYSSHDRAAAGAKPRPVKSQL